MSPHSSSPATPSALHQSVSVACKTSQRKILSATQVTASQSASATRGCRPSVRVLPPCLSPVDSSAATAEHHVCNDAGSSSLDGESGSAQQPPSSFFEDCRKDQPCNLGNAAAGQDGADGDRQLAGYRQGDRHQEPGECTAVSRTCCLALLLLTCGFSSCPVFMLVARRRPLNSTCLQLVRGQSKESERVVHGKCRGMLLMGLQRGWLEDLAEGRVVSGG